MAQLVSPPEELLLPLHVPSYTLMGPGPSNCSPRVMAALTHPMVHPCGPELIKVHCEIRRGLQYAMQTSSEFTMAVSGSGHAAMECALANIIEPGDVLLATVTGLWGERATEIGKRQGAAVKQLRKELDQVFSLDELEEGLKEHTPNVLFIAHGETSGGTLQPLEGIGPLCHKYNCLLVVDAVASLAAVPLFTDKWEIDVVYSGSQKALSAPPGTSPVSFSPRAWEKVESRTSTVRSFYLDAKLLAHNWGVLQPLRYHHTGFPTNSYGMRESLAELAEEGLEAAWKRHQKNSELLWKGLEEMGLELFVSDKKHRLPTVTLVKLPDGVDWQEVIRYVKEKYSLEISPGLGPSSGKVWRIGLMGYNSKDYNVDLALRALKNAMDNVPRLNMQ